MRPIPLSRFQQLCFRSRRAGVAQFGEETTFLPLGLGQDGVTSVTAPEPPVPRGARSWGDRGCAWGEADGAKGEALALLVSFQPFLGEEGCNNMPRAINHSLATPPGSPPPAPGPSIAGGAEGPPAERRGRRDEQSRAAPAHLLQPPQHGAPRPGAARLRPGRHLPLGG